MFSFEQEQEYDFISQNELFLDNDIYHLPKFPDNYYNDTIPQYKEEIIGGENIKESEFNNEIKKKDKPVPNKNFQDNTGFTSNKPYKQLVDENQNNLNNTLNLEIFPQNNENESPKKEKKLGRKLKNADKTDETDVHDKFADDNLMNVCKHIILKDVHSTVNDLIQEYYKDNNISIINRKHLLKKINQNQIKNGKVDYNKEFQNKKLKDIFSNDISTKYRKNYYREYNKDLIEELLNLEDEEKKNLFEKIFNLSFFDCLNHFRGKTNINEFGESLSLDEALKKFEDEDYKQKFKNFVQNYEKIIWSKKSRNRKKKNSK